MNPVWTGQQRAYLVDGGFAYASKIARERSGMDDFRMFQLWHMMGEAAKLPTGDVIEVGCAYGGSAFLIAVRARVAGVMDRIHLFDTFDGLVKASEVDTLKNGDMRGPELNEVGAFFKQYEFSDMRITQGVFPECANLEDVRFRFAHIDVDIYQSAKDAFAAIWPRMVKGGIVVIDDYGEADCDGITKLVDELLPMADAIWFLHGALQAIAVKR